MAIETLSQRNPAMQGKILLDFWGLQMLLTHSVWRGKKDTQQFPDMRNEQKQNGEWGDHLLNCVSLCRQCLESLEFQCSALRQGSGSKGQGILSTDRLLPLLTGTWADTKIILGVPSV
jgi:hypothetical protein